MSQFSSGPFDNKDPFGQLPPNPSPYQSPQGGYGYQAPPPSPPLSPLALISLLSGIFSAGISFLGCCCGIFTALSFAGGLASVITGHIALAKFTREPGRESGKEIAIIGLIFGYIGLAISIVAIIIIIIAIFAPAVAVPFMPKNQGGFQFPPVPEN